MKRQTQYFIYGAGILIALFLANNASAQGQGMPVKNFETKEMGKARWEERRAEMHKQLGLTADQEKQLEEHKTAHKNGMNLLYENIKTKRKELAEELQNEELDMEKLMKIHAELKVLNGQKEDSRLESILEVREILTPEQFATFIEHTRKMDKRFNQSGMKGSGAEFGRK